MAEEPSGAFIDVGASDWQVFQQDPRGRAEIAVAGRWACPEKPKGVYVRLVHEDTNVAVASHLDWRPVRMRTKAARGGHSGSWRIELKDVPAGGLYRLETCLRTGVHDWEWARRGDARHFLGVGDLWVIAGQSNSAGYGRGPCYDPPELGVHAFTNAMRWTLAAQPMNESTDSAHPANTELSNSGQGPWLHWAKIIKRRMGFPVGLIQASLGGAGLCRYDPAERDHPLYDVMLQAVAGAGGKVRGILWYQGCTDAGSRQTARTYERRFIAAVRAWRRALRSPRLPVLTVQINRVLGEGTEDGDAAWSILREAQRRVPKRLAGVTVSPALDLHLSDFVHNSAYGNLLLAERVAQSALAAVYGRKVDHLAPDIRFARRARGGRRVRLTFDNVADRLAPLVAPAAAPFRVEDAGGVVPIRQAQYTGGADVLLHLARALRGRAVVHGAYGSNPPAVPYDCLRFMPMLGFHGVKID